MDLIGKNGKIDGILAAQVLLDGGVFFFKPGELYYDGTYHQVKGMQANTTAMRDFPGIFDKMDTLAPELVNLMVYIEKNTMFRVKLEDLGEEIREFLQNEDMTGMTFLYLFKWHLLALNRNVDGITVSMETRVYTGIPDAKKKVRELVEMLVGYNGTDPKSVAIKVVEVDEHGNEVKRAEEEETPVPAEAPAPAPMEAPSTAQHEEIESSDTTQVASIVETAVSDSGAMDPVAEPMQTTAASPVAVAAELSTVRFTGFSDPKIKEMRDKIADKQEDFGGDLEEILEDLYDHIDELDDKGVPEDVMKSVLDLERDCYAELTNLRVEFDNIGAVEYRISRRCSRKHEQWEDVYRKLPSVLKAAEEERKNQARKQVEDEINEIRAQINLMVKNYNDAKAVVEYAQKQLESSKGNFEEDRKKLVARGEAAVGAVDQRIRENNMRIEEMEVENKKLEDELKDASGFALGRKKTIRDTIEYNMSFINKYRDVGQNLEAERQQVADEWNRKLHDLVGDTDKLKHEITENMGKMKQLEQSVAAEKQNLLQKEAELSKM